MHLLQLATAGTDWISDLQSFNPETDTTMLSAELVWFVGGIFTAFAWSGFSMILRGLRGTITDVQL